MIKKDKLRFHLELRQKVPFVDVSMNNHMRSQFATVYMCVKKNFQNIINLLEQGQRKQQ